MRKGSITSRLRSSRFEAFQDKAARGVPFRDGFIPNSSDREGLGLASTLLYLIPEEKGCRWPADQHVAHRQRPRQRKNNVVTTIRGYRVKLGQADQAIQLAQMELIPVVSAISGFVAYQAVVVGPQSILSVSTYRDRGAADAANRAAAAWDETRLAALIDGPAKVTVGDVRISIAGASEKPSAIAAPEAAQSVDNSLLELITR